MDKNLDTARRWYRHAAARGYALSQNALGLLYVRGAGVPQDKVLAAALFLLAAADGNPQAKSNVQHIRAELNQTEQDQALALAKQFAHTDDFLKMLDQRAP